MGSTRSQTFLRASSVAGVLLCKRTLSQSTPRGRQLIPPVGSDSKDCVFVMLVEGGSVLPCRHPTGLAVDKGISMLACLHLHGKQDVDEGLTAAGVDAKAAHSLSNLSGVSAELGR